LINCTAIGYTDRSAQAQTTQIFFDASCAPGVNIKRQQFKVGTLKQVSSFPARRSAGIEHVSARSRVKQFCSALGTRILHRHKSLEKSGQCVDRDRPL
jgi:hypothetical protein